ncbi:hypothetical protein F5Y01DRAFT_124278 [Xylaria sp. FL0043]|nr:hypothetical protein F5Y01DRAFT_124278 [Xylaria sp. FL0043]
MHTQSHCNHTTGSVSVLTCHLILRKGVPGVLCHGAATDRPMPWPWNRFERHISGTTRQRSRPVTNECLTCQLLSSKPLFIARSPSNQMTPHILLSTASKLQWRLGGVACMTSVSPLNSASRSLLDFLISSYALKHVRAPVPTLLCHMKFHITQSLGA